MGFYDMVNKQLAVSKSLCVHSPTDGAVARLFAHNKYTFEEMKVGQEESYQIKTFTAGLLSSVNVKLFISCGLSMVEKVELCEALHEQELRYNEWFIYNEALVLLLSDERVRTVPKLSEFQLQFLQHVISSDKHQIGTGVSDMLTIMQKWQNGTVSLELSVDFETNTLYPKKHDAQVLCVGISSRTEAVAFHPERYPQLTELFKAIMRNPRIKKVIHNIRFEWQWLVQYFGVSDSVSVEDTMLMQYVLDNTSITLELKKLSEKYLNVKDYSLSKYYIKSGGVNELNNMDKLPEKQLYTYCAQDVFYTLALYDHLYPKLEQEQLLLAYAFLVKAQCALAELGLNGIRYDSMKASEYDAVLMKDYNALYNELRDIYPEWNGKLTGTGFLNFVNKQFKLDSTEMTKQNIADLDHPFLNDIAKLRKLNHIQNTYIYGFSDRTIDGMIYSDLALRQTATYRTSCSKPNFQNMPKRNENDARIVRECVIPSRRDFYFVEYDYKALEIATAACIYKDPNWLSYVNDPSKDMHRDVAAEIFNYRLDEFGKLKHAKKVRNVIKNALVFPSVYGANEVSIGKAIWLQVRDNPDMQELVHRLKLLRIHTQKDMIQHVADYLVQYWQVRYPVYNGLRQELYKKAQRDGYIQHLAGFRYRGPLSFTECCNYPVQGLAAFIKLYTVTQMQNWLKKEGMKTKLVMEIHDSLLFETCTSEDADILAQVKYFGEEQIRKDYPFIICLLTLERECYTNNWWEKAKHDKLAI